MSIQELTKHPELLNRESLFELRKMVAAYPYYQPARLLMLKNLYILHDSSFDEELRRASIYFTDRKVLFNLVEQAHYQLKRRSPLSFSTSPDRRQNNDAADSSRTVSLIDSFLSTVPQEDLLSNNEKKKAKAHRKPTAADATVDYVAYLLSTDFEELQPESMTEEEKDAHSAPQMNGGELIDAFINNDGGKIVLQDNPEYVPEMPIADNNDHEPEDEYLTETLAGIYIKQGRYEKALDIMKRIDKQSGSTKKNIYFDDQKRFLEKLIANKARKKS